MDLSADAGESFGPRLMGNDEALFLDSVNLACSFHAGDPLTTERKVRLAKETGVEVGVQRGFPELVGFGRRDMRMTPDELHAAVLYQLGAVEGFVLKLHHVKPHGALCLRMMHDEEAAHAIPDGDALDAVGVAIRAF